MAGPIEAEWKARYVFGPGGWRNSRRYEPGAQRSGQVDDRGDAVLPDDGAHSRSVARSTGVVLDVRDNHAGIVDVASAAAVIPVISSGHGQMDRNAIRPKDRPSRSRRDRAGPTEHQAGVIQSIGSCECH